MKNNILIKVITLLVLVQGVFTSCDDTPEIKDVSVTAVQNLYAPSEDKFLVLQSISNAYFEWEKAYAEDNSIVYYEILFDLVGGDFSNPLYIASSDNRGLSTGVTLTTKVLNNIATLGGAGTGAEIDLIWTVRSNRGLNFVLAEESRAITMVRLTSIDGLQSGELLYITGEASEDGQQVKEVVDGSTTIYEIITTLEASKSFSFYSELSGTKRYFEVDDEGAKFNEVNSASAPVAIVTETSVYRIRLDFETATVSLEKIEKLEIRNSWTQVLSEFSYVAQGVWELKDYNVALASTDWGFDERYKFVFTIDGEVEEWGPLQPSDNRPSLSDDGYFDMAVTETGQWAGNPFKFASELCDSEDLSRYTVDVSVVMSADANYTHKFDNIR